MKVLFIQILEALSGSEKYFIEIMPLLKAKGIECEFLCVYRDNGKTGYREITDLMEAKDIKVHYLKTKSSINFTLLKNINKVIKKGNFDLIHGHLLYSDVWLACIKILFNRKLKVVSTKHSYDEKFASLYGFDSSKRLYNLYFFLCRFSEPFINRSFAVSHGLKKLFLGLNIGKEDKMDVIHHAFETKYIPAAKPDRYRSSEKQLILVGRLTAFKGHKYAFEALKIVLKKHPEAKLVILGRGEMEADLKNQCQEMGIAESVEFKGFQAEAMHFMANSDIVLIPSISEPFGIVFIEAFEVKTPVICFDVPAGNELILDDKSGCLIAPYNVNQLADKINELFQSPSKRNALAEEAFKRLKNELSPDVMVDKTIEFYKKSLL